MTKAHATPEEFRFYTDGGVTHQRSWSDAFRLAIESLSPSVHDRGILELGFEVYQDPQPFQVVVDRRVDIVGKGGGFRCAASRVHGGFDFLPSAHRSRMRELGCYFAPSDGIRTRGRLDLDSVYVVGAGGKGVVYDGSGTNNVNGSNARRVGVEECALGGMYAVGADAGHLVWDHCEVHGLSGGPMVGGPFTARDAAVQFAMSFVPNLHVSPLQRFNPTHWGVFEREEVRGFAYEGANTITMISPLCEWSGQQELGNPGSLFAVNTRGFYVDPNGGQAKVDLAHDESGGLPAQIHGAVLGGNYQRTLEAVPGRARPLRLLGSGDVGPYTMHLNAPDGTYRGAVQLAPGGASYLILTDAQDRMIAIAPNAAGDAIEVSRSAPPSPWVPFLRLGTKEGTDRMEVADGAFFGPRLQWTYADGAWFARTGGRMFHHRALSPHDELATDLDGNPIDGGGVYWLEETEPPVAADFKVGDVVRSSASNPTVAFWVCGLVRIQESPRRYEKRMVPFGRLEY